MVFGGKGGSRISGHTFGAGAFKYVAVASINCERTVVRSPVCGGIGVEVIRDNGLRLQPALVGNVWGKKYGVV